jgi:hypothetical protein
MGDGVEDVGGLAEQSRAARELVEVELSEKVTKQQVSQRETAELKSAAEWTLSATGGGDEESMGDHDDLPICRKFLQLGRLHEQGQPLEQLDEVIEEIRELMIRSVETASKEGLGRKEEAATTQKQQQQQGDGADEQLQRFVWDPGGFPQLRVEAHEQELMNFAAEEYDAGASLHVSQPASQPSRQDFKSCIQERRNPHLKFE